MMMINGLLTVVCRNCRKTISRLEAIAHDGLCAECYHKRGK